MGQITEVLVCYITIVVPTITLSQGSFWSFLFNCLSAHHGSPTQSLSALVPSSVRPPAHPPTHSSAPASLGSPTWPSDPTHHSFSFWPAQLRLATCCSPASLAFAGDLASPFAVACGFFAFFACTFFPWFSIA